MNFNFDSIIQYFDIGIIAILVSGALFGFLKGLFKSSYNLLVFSALLITGWFLSPIIVRSIFDFDISEYFTVTIDGITYTSINETLPGIIDKYVPEFAGLLAPGSNAYLLVQALIFMVLRIVVMILWLILTGTVFKFIFWIIYLIIKPKPKYKNGKQVGKSFFSRLGGLMVGTVHALLVVFLFSIAFSGLTSIGTTLVEMLPETESEEPYLLVLSEEAASLQAPIPELEEYEAVFRFMANYRETLSGKISSFITIGDEPADEYLFDELFSLKIRNHKLKLKSELQTALKVYELLVENIDGEINLD